MFFIKKQLTFVDGPASTHRVVFGKERAVENSYFSAENFYKTKFTQFISFYRQKKILQQYLM